MPKTLLKKMDNLKIVNGTPPNYELLKAVGLVKEGNIYCYGSTIFNPSDKEIPSDIKYHEQQHSIRQGNNPSEWWNRYCNDPAFRREEEIMAYAKQYRLIKNALTDKDAKEFLEEYAINLSSLYNLGITKSQAATAIRKYDVNA